MWQLASNVASLVSSERSVAIDLAHPEFGAKLFAPDGAELAQVWNLRQLRNLPLVESYVRDNDIVACYGPGDDFPFHTDVYWSVVELPVEPQPQLALSLLVSVRTDLLDTHPEIELTTLAPPRSLEAIPTDAGVMFYGPLNRATSLVDFASAEDCAEEELSLANGNSDVVSRHLFSHFLEKGVIRRARLFAALVDPNTSPDQAAILCEAFLTTGLPLTT